MKRTRWLIAAIGLLVGGCAAPPPAPDATLPADSVAAMDAGTAAADREDWDRAREQFLAAHHAAPRSHLPLYALALAEERGGCDLAAVCWYRATLAADPDAANVPAIRSRIDRLDRRLADQARDLIARARKADALLGEDIRRGPPSPADVRKTLEEAADLIGRPAQAPPATDLEDPLSAGQRGALAAARAKARAGDFAGARADLADAASAAPADVKVLRAFAVAQGELGDLPGAMKTAARIESPLDRTWTWSFVAEACGDLAMAEIFDWSATAENYLVGPLARDPEGLLRDHESDSPEEMIDLLARVARDLAGSVSMLRNKNAYWREQEE